VQFIVQEAPAWSVSMVVHMVTLVTMAMVTVSEPVPYKAHRLIVTPPKKEKKIEEVLEVITKKQPATLEENVPIEVKAPDTEIELQKVVIQPDGGPEASPAPMETSDFGLERVPSSDLLTVIGPRSSNGLKGRGMATKAQLVKLEGGSVASEKAVASALNWLASHQMPDGGWSFNHTGSPSCQGQCRDPGTLAQARNAATGLALLPFLGSGETHKDSRKYKTVVNNGLYFLINRMRIDSHGGALNESGGNMYSHGIASIALCEAYAMTHDKSLHRAAQLSLHYICYAQDPRGGGWRYSPRQKGDTSVVGWQLMALKSGYMAELTFPPSTIRKATEFLNSVQVDGGAMYGYTAPKTGEATTAIGLLSRMYLGWKRDNPALQRGIQFLDRRGPSTGNMYYNYYATQVMRHWEGPEWRRWNQRMRDHLVRSQAKQGHEKGSWFVGGGDMGAGPGGRLYCTAMATMILEVYYRHMPIYRSQSVDQDFPE